MRPFSSSYEIIFTVKTFAVCCAEEDKNMFFPDTCSSMAFLINIASELKSERKKFAQAKHCPLIKNP